VKLISVLSVLLCAQVLATAPAGAQASFYQGKQINLIVGSGTGGGYDSYARLVARHLGRHIPGEPTVIVQNMPGAGSLNMTNYVNNVAPKDGTVLGAPQNGVAFEPLFHLLSPGGKTARFDPLKMHWIGSATKENFIPFVLADSEIKSFGDLRTRGARFGASSPNTDNGILALLLNRMFGTKIEIIHGYPGSTGSLIIALEQKEIDGLAGMPFASLRVNASHLLSVNKVRFLTQIGMTRHPQLPDVPLLLDEAKDKADREALIAIIARYEMARPVFAAPEVPSDRVALLRKAFAAMVLDEGLIKDAESQKLDIDLVRGEDIEKIVADTYRLPEDIIARVRALISLNN
jgi:tripartite-type tricarboxylate transporter receptor subunit TctC